MTQDAHAWREIGDRVWVRRYAFLDQTIGVIAGSERVVVVDTRSTRAQGAKVLAALRALTPLPHLVVNTHHHWDHVLGNAAFRPCEAWGHERCAATLRASGDEQKAAAHAWAPELAAEIDETPVDPPERTFAAVAEFDLGGRTVELRYFGRGHTDNDIAIAVPDAGVVFGGDLFEQSAPPTFGDAFPLEWPATLGHVLDLGDGMEAGGGSGGPRATVFVPGHGEPVDADFVRAQLADLAFIAEAARRADPGARGSDAAARAALADEVARHLGWPDGAAHRALERALAQVRGEIG
jgi:glyoxylase-like metal-dependent hydrolase (beta-lactamase superfamily II)